MIDGTGAAAVRRADVAIAGDRIAAIGDVAKAQGAREIDVSGQDRRARALSTCTRTTTAPCSPPPRWRRRRARASPRSSPAIAAISLAPLRLDRPPPPPLDLIGEAGRLRYARFADYLAALDKAPAAINAACLVGHSTLRVGAMARPRPAGQRRRDRADARAAAGGARRRRDRHVDRARSTPRPFMRPPPRSRRSPKLLRPAGALYTTHMRDEAEHVLDSLDESFRGRAARPRCRW